VLVQEGKLAHAILSPWWDDFRDALVLVQEEKLGCTRFPPLWNDVVRDVWNDVVRDILDLLQEGNPT
jgi:hypothetical protein